MRALGDGQQERRARRRPQLEGRRFVKGAEEMGRLEGAAGGGRRVEKNWRWRADDDDERVVANGKGHAGGGRLEVEIGGE